jgi:MFS family permease
MSATGVSSRTAAAERVSLGAVLGERNIWLLFMLGFAAGHPFHAAWHFVFARVDSDIDDALFLSMTDFGITSLIAVAAAPLLDRYSFPGLAGLGHRKSWVAAVLCAAVALLALFAGTKFASEGAALRFASLSGVAAMFVSAFLWIALDTLRIDLYRGRAQAVAASALYLGGLTSLALLTRLAVPRGTVEEAATYAVLFVIGVVALLLVREPAADPAGATAPSIPYVRAWTTFVARNGRASGLLLAAIACYALAASAADFLGRQGYIIDLLRTDFRNYEPLTGDGLSLVDSQTTVTMAIGVAAGMLVAFAMPPARAFGLMMLSILGLLVFFVLCKIVFGFTVITVAGLYVLRTLIWSGAFIIYVTIAARLTARPNTAGHLAIVAAFGGVFWISEKGMTAIAMPYGSYAVATGGIVSAIAAMALMHLAARVAKTERGAPGIDRA